MWKKSRAWLFLTVLVGGAFAFYFEPTHCVRGWLHGDAFFDGRPTSYWRQIVERDQDVEPRALIESVGTQTTVFEKLKDSLGIQSRADSSVHLLRRSDADAVLRQLAADDNAAIAGFAREVLDVVRPLQPFDPQTDDEIFAWLRLLCKHRREPRDFEKLVKMVGG